MTPLERALRERSQAEGPITVETFMEACNAYYYATRDPFGAAGDFTTAPEISQMFGEMVGAALADCGRERGAARDAVYVELGPGRGTLAADALRVLRSGRLRRRSPSGRNQPGPARRPGEFGMPEARWHETIESFPTRPLLLVANEFLDALPIRQIVDGTERRITVGRWRSGVRSRRRDRRDLACA